MHPSTRIRPSRHFAAGAAIGGLFLAAASGVHAANVYIALGDSITFGETDLNYVGSFGDRGYVAGYANTLATRNGGVRPTVINLAIDGETANSFLTGSGRTPPVVGRTDIPLAAQNLNYNPSAIVTQSQLFAAAVSSQQALGNTVSTVTITLGFNELGALSALPPAQALAAIPQTLANYQTTYRNVLTQVRTLLPNASLSLLGYFNPFPADPASPGAPIFNTGGVQLNNVIRGLAAQFGASFVDTATPFVGREAAYTYLDEMPSGSAVGGAFGGTLPIGNVHPNAAGYAAIAAAVSAVPEPAMWASMLAGLVGIGLLVRRRAAASA